MDGPRLLGGRYTFVKHLRSGAKTITWLAHEKVTDIDVVASIIPKARVAGLAPILGARHEHLATILDLIEHPVPEELPTEEPPPEGAVVAVAEYVRGQSLGARLDAGSLAVEDAVEWAARTADGLALIHRRGGVHGAVSPRALIVSRSDRGAVPLLTHLVVPPSGAYCAPERVTGAGPSVADDLWALVATLYSALSRRAPFQGATRTDLARAIVAAEPAPLDGIDADLADIVRRGLTREASVRYDSALSLCGALRDWMEKTGARSLGDFAPVSTAVSPAEPVPNVGDLSLVAALAQPDTDEARAPVPSLAPEPDDGDLVDLSDAAEIRQSGVPRSAGGAESGPLPPPSAGPSSGIRTTPPARKRSISAILTLLAALGLLSAGLGVAAGRLRAHARRTEALQATSRAVEPPAPPGNKVSSGDTPPNRGSAPKTSAGSPTEAPPMAIDSTRAPSASLGDLNACVAAALPEGTVAGVTDLGFLCIEKDFWTTARRFDLEVAKHGKAPGMVLFAYLGRFDLAVIAYVWHRCCPAGSVPFVVATPKGVCDDLDDAVHAVGKDPSPAASDTYASAVDCLYTHAVHHPTEFWDRVGPKDSRGYFDQFREAVGKGR